MGHVEDAESGESDADIRRVLCRERRRGGRESGSGREGPRDSLSLHLMRVIEEYRAVGQEYEKAVGRRLDVEKGVHALLPRR